MNLDNRYCAKCATETLHRASLCVHCNTLAGGTPAVRVSRTLAGIESAALDYLRGRKRGPNRPDWLFGRNNAWRAVADAEAKAGLANGDYLALGRLHRNMDMRELEAVLHEGA